MLQIPLSTLGFHPCEQLCYRKFLWVAGSGDLEKQVPEDLREQTLIASQKSGSVAGNENPVLWQDNTEGAEDFNVRGII